MINARTGAAWLLVSSLSAASLTAAGCGGGPTSVANGPTGSRDSAEEAAVREQCEPTGRRVVATDVNNDGTPDIRHVYEGSLERCAQFDMNFDAIVDVTRFFGPDGHTVVREEHDFDFDGRLDQVSYYEGGVITRAELDTNFDNEFDTWLWCEGNLMHRSERDRRHRGRADTWEYFTDGVITEARYDNNNDGDPDRWEMFEGGRLTEVRQMHEGEIRSEMIPEEARGSAEDPLTCDGSVAERRPAPTPPPAVLTGTEGGTDGTDGGAPPTGVDNAGTDADPFGMNETGANP